MSQDEGNKNFPISQVLRRIKELGWYVGILDGGESEDWVNIQLIKDRSDFTLQIMDCGTKEDAKKAAAKGSWTPGIRFGTAIGRFYVGSPTNVNFNNFLPFFDFYCPDEKREKELSEDENNKNFPISQVLRHIEELGWRIDVQNSGEGEGYAFITVTKGPLCFQLYIQDYRYNEDAKEGVVKNVIWDYRFGVAFGRFVVRSHDPVDFNGLSPFFDINCPEEKREKKETRPPPPTMEIPQADQDRSQQLQKEFKEMKAKYDRGEISEAEYQSAMMSRSYEMMGMFGKRWDKLTEAMKQSGYIDPSAQTPDIGQAVEMMKHNPPYGSPLFPGIPSATGSGSELPNVKIKCPSCGIFVEKKKFCSECGAALVPKE
jgi:hypothetical protein